MCAPSHRAAAALLALAVSLACKHDDPPRTVAQAERAPKPARAVTPAPAESDAALDLERLGALGYMGFTDKPADATKRGVVRIDRKKSAPGYNLYTNTKLCSAELVDADGAVVRSWHADDCGHWANVQLLQNGDLLAVGVRHRRPGRPPGDDHDRVLLRYDFAGALLWERQLPVHHDVEATSDGRIFTLTRHDRPTPAVGFGASVTDNSIFVLDDGGAVRERLSLYQLLAAAPHGIVWRDGPPRGRVLKPIDLLHANAVTWVDASAWSERPAGWGQRGALVTMRHQDRLALIDWATRRVTWLWGEGELDGPHDATILANHHVLLLDNGQRRGWSRLVELDPASGAIVWQYRAPEPKTFFTATRGSAQELANGNILVAVADSGYAFEITRKGERVWEYWNPHFNAAGQRSTFEQLKRYEPSFVQPLLARIK